MEKKIKPKVKTMISKMKKILMTVKMVLTESHSLDRTAMAVNDGQCCNTNINDLESNLSDKPKK